MAIISSKDSKFTFQLTGRELITHLHLTYDMTLEKATQDAEEQTEQGHQFFVRLDKDDIDKLRQGTLDTFNTLAVVERGE